MPKYELSEAAENDIEKILDYSYLSFGEKRAFDYYGSLKECLDLLAEQPLLGRAIDHVRAGYLKHQHKKHSVYYTLKKGRIFIIRVLHQSMDYERHL